MKIFRFCLDVDNYASLSSIGETYAEKRKFTQQSMRKFKSSVRLIPTDHSLPIPDVFQLGYNIPVLTDAAIAVCAPHIPDDVERIAIECEALNLTALNVLHRIPALCVDASKLSYDSGGLIRQIEDGVFDAATIGDAGLFTIKEMNCVFYTEKLLDAVQHNNLQGLLVKPIGVAK